MQASFALLPIKRRHGVVFGGADHTPQDADRRVFGGHFTAH
jgi:hypothetical protein